MISRRTAVMLVGAGIGLGSIAVAGAHEHDPAGHDPDPDGPEILELTHDPADGPVIPATEITVTARAHDPEGQLDEIVFAEGRNYTRVDSVPASGGSETVTYTYEQAPRHLRSGYQCMAWAKSTDGRMGEQKHAEGPEIYVPVRAQFESINDPVPAGEQLYAEVSVEHIGEMEDIGPVPDLHLVVGEDTVDSYGLDLAWNEETTLTMGYETYPVQQDVEFDLQLVAGETVADVRTVAVHA